jgi:membrane protein YqaA with SNARE-associated domain
MRGKLAFLDRWYENTKSAARHKNAEKVLIGTAFLESSVFLVPVDALLIPMVQADHSKAWRYAAIAAIASVIGGIAGYLVGYFFSEAIAVPVLEWLGKGDKMDSFSEAFQKHGALWVFGAGLTPFPYKVITIMSGVLKINFGIFLAASILARSMRFFLVAWVVKTFGDQAERIMKEHFAKFTIGIFLLLGALWAVYKYGFAH